MKVLVTGGAGFIGSAVVRDLVGRQVGVVNLDKLTYAAVPGALAAVEDRPGYAFVRADIADRAAVDAALAAHRPDAILHLAAETHVDRSIDGPADFVATNVVGTAVLLDAALAYWQGLAAPAQAAFRFVLVSTDEVYGALGPEDPPFTAASPHRPNSPYAATKAAADHLVRAWGQTYGLPAITVHATNNYGPWQFPEKLIPLTIANALEGRPLPVYGRGANRRDWLHVTDHARALWQVLQVGVPGVVYAVGSGQDVANLAVVERLCALVDRLAPDPAVAGRADLITFVDDRPGHDFRYAVDPADAAAALGWRPMVDLEAGLEDTVAWYLANADWWRAIRRARYDGRRLGRGRL